MERPTMIGAPVAQAMRAHTGRLEFADQVVLPRQDVGALDAETLTIMSVRGGDEQTLCTAGAQALHHPQHPHERRHDPAPGGTVP